MAALAAWERSAGDRQQVNIDPGKEARRPCPTLTSRWRLGRDYVLATSSQGVGDTLPSSPLALLKALVVGGGVEAPTGFIVGASGKRSRGAVPV